jgi:hypothetical protein
MQSWLRGLIWGAAQLQAIVVVMFVDSASKEPYGWWLYLSTAAISGLVSLVVLDAWRGRSDTPTTASRVAAVSFGTSMIVSGTVAIARLFIGH